MSDTGLNIKLYADDKEFKKSLKDLESEAKRSSQAFKTFSEQAKNLKGADKVNATTNALKALENELNATTSKAQLLKNKLNEVGNDSKLGKSSEQYKQLQRELTATENKAQILKGKIAEIGSGAGGAGGVLGGLQGTLEKFGLSADGAATAAGMLASKGFGLLVEGAIKGAEALAKATIEAVKITAAFDSSLSAIQAFSGGTEADLAAIRETALELSSATKYTATEVSDSMQVLAKAGWDTSDIQNGMKGVLDTATASGESVETAAAVIVQSLNSFGAGADQAAHFGDVLTTSANSAYLSVSELGESMKYVGPLAGSMGLSLEDVNTALVALAENGIRGGQAGNVLRSFISRLSADTDGALEKFKQLTGESAFDSSGNLKSLTTIFNSLRTAMSGYTAQEQAVIAKNLAGERGFSGLLAILNKSEDAYESLNKTIENSTGATARANDTMMDNLQGDIDILKSNIEKLQIDWGSMFTPMLRGLTQFATGAVQAVDSIFDDSNITIIEEAKKSISEVDEALKEADALEFKFKFPDLDQETKDFNKNIAILEQAVGKNWDSLSSTEQNNLKKAIDELSGIYPAFTGLVDEATGAINLQADSFSTALKNAKEYYDYLYQARLIESLQMNRAELEGQRGTLEVQKQDLQEVKGLIDQLETSTSLSDDLSAYLNIKFNPYIADEDVDEIVDTVGSALKDTYHKMTDTFSGMGKEEFGVADLKTVMENITGGLSNSEFEQFMLDLYGGNLSAVEEVGKKAGLELSTGFYEWMLQNVKDYSESNSELHDTLVNAFEPIGKELQDQIDEIEGKQTGLDKSIKTSKEYEDQCIATSEALKKQNEAMSEADTLVSDLENAIVEENGKYKKVDLLKPYKEGVNKEGLGDLRGYTKTTSKQLAKATEDAVSSPEISAAIAKLKANTALQEVPLRNGTFFTRQDLEALEEQRKQSESLTEAYKKQEGAAKGVVDANDDIKGSSNGAADGLEKEKTAAEKAADAAKRAANMLKLANERLKHESQAEGWFENQIKGIQEAEKKYNDYVDKVTKSLAWDAHKEYKPIGAGDSSYVTMEKQNKNLEDYIKHQTERNDLFDKYLPQIEKIAPKYAAQIYDAMASGDEEAIQGYYENMRNTLEKQGEDTLFALAEEQDQLLEKMDEQNREMAVRSAKANMDAISSTIKGRMSDDTKAEYEAQVDSLVKLGRLSDAQAEQLKANIGVIQALGGDLTDAMKSALSGPQQENAFNEINGWLVSGIQASKDSIRQEAEKFGIEISDAQYYALVQAINSKDPEQIRAAVQNVYGSDALWKLTEEGQLEVTYNPDPEAGEKASEAVTLTKEGAQAKIDSQPAQEVTSAMNSTTTVEPDPEATQKGVEVAEDAASEVQQGIDSNPQEVENKVKQNTTVNDGDIEDNTGDSTAIDVTKIVNVKEVPIITNAGAADRVAKEVAENPVDVNKVVNVNLIPIIKNATDVDTEAQDSASKTTTTTQTENVNRKVNVNASIKTNITGDSGSDVGEEFGKGIASGIQSQAGSISGTANSVMSAAAASAGSGAYGKGSAIGGYFGSGMAAGINSQVGAVAAAAARLEAEAERVVRAKAKIASPSKVMEQMGIYWGEGFAVGIDKSTSEVIAASDKIMDSLINATASPDAATSAAKSFANSYATSLSKELEAEIKKDKKSAIEAITDSFDSNKGSRDRASAALKAANSTSRTSADFKEANKKEADEWKEKASDLQKKIDDYQSKIDKAKKKNASKKDKKAAKEAKAKIAEQKKQQEEYLKYAYIAAQEEARIEAERSRIDSAISSVDTNATLRENKLIVDNKGKELDVTQKLQLAEQKRTEALKVLNSVNANADATTEQKIDAYNTYADSVKAAAEAHQALADSILNEVSTSVAWAKAQQTISNGGAPLSAAQELSIAVNQLSAAKRAQKAIEEDIYATEEQRLSAAQALADAYTEQYNAQRKINQELINSISTYYSEIETRAKYEQKKYGEQDTQTQIAWTEAALINARNKMLQLERNRNTLQSEYIAGAKETVALEEQLLNLKKQEQQELINNPQEELSDVKLNIDIVSENGIREIQYALSEAIKNYNYLQFNAVSEDLVKSAKQTVKSLEDELSSTIVSLIDADLKAIEDWQTHYEAYYGRELNNAEKVTKAERALASLQERKNWLIQNELYTDEVQLKIERELVTLTKERNEAQKAANKDLMNSVSRQLDWYETYLKYNTRKAITEQQRVELAERELREITDAYYKIQENAPTAEEDLEYLKKVVEAQEEYNSAVEAFNKKIISDSTKKTDEWRTRTEYAQKRALNNYQEIEYATRKLEEVQNAYNLLRLKGTLSLEDELEMMNKVTSASQELNNAYKSLYKNLNKNLTLDKPFTAAEANIKDAIENMESHITGLNDLMSARAAVEARGLSDLAKSYLNGLSAEESANLYIELQNATEEDFKKFNDTLTEYALKDKQYSDLQQEQEEILVDHVTNIAQAVNQISTNGIQISSSNMGTYNAGIATQQNTQSTAALERSMSSIVTAMLGMSTKFDQMSGDMLATMNDFSQEVTQALSKVGISIDGREFGRIVRQYA